MTGREKPENSGLTSAQPGIREGTLSKSTLDGSRPRLRRRLRGRTELTMPWILFYAFWTILFSLFVVNSAWDIGIELPPIHWNVSNPMFKTSNNDHIIDVNIGDEIDFVCPYVEDPSQAEEYYIIYQVTKREYDDCNIYTSTSKSMIVNCSSPWQRKKFTILFLRYSPTPYGIEFERGGTYYFITTSTGQSDGLMNLHQGACVYGNMKLTIQVCCDTTTNPEKEDKDIDRGENEVVPKNDMLSSHGIKLSSKLSLVLLIITRTLYMLSR